MVEVGVVAGEEGVTSLTSSAYLGTQIDLHRTNSKTGQL